MPRTLILEPTRELAAQVEDSFDKYGKNHKLNVALIIGGVSFDDQDQKLMRGVDVLIATPGRLLDHFERGRLLMSGVELLVIDEADRMLDMGFIPDIERICKLVPFTRQTLFFTATMPAEIRRITEQFLHNPVKVEVAKPATTVAAILQQLVKTGREPHDKRDTLRRTIRAADSFKNAIIFCNRKREVAQLHRSLVRHGFNAVALHGDLDQSARTAALDSFRSGESKLLIASDVAARGLDIPDVSHVFNFDVPHHADDYVHRIGRTGRAGKTGTAYTIVGPGDGKAVAEIEKLIGQSIPWADGLPVDESQASAPAHADGHGDVREPRRDDRGGGRHKQRGQRGERGGGRPRAPREDHRHEPQQARPEPREQPQAALVAPIARIEEARHRHPPARPPRESADDVGSHLPAFLLRPVRGKA
jgi:superfamily II DNA/RNA helicase